LGEIRYKPAFAVSARLLELVEEIAALRQAARDWRRAV